MHRKSAMGASLSETVSHRPVRDTPWTGFASHPIAPPFSSRGLLFSSIVVKPSACERVHERTLCTRGVRGGDHRIAACR